MPRVKSAKQGKIDPETYPKTGSVLASGADISPVWPLGGTLVGYVIRIARDLSALRIRISLFLKTIVWAIPGARSGSETVVLARGKRVDRRLVFILLAMDDYLLQRLGLPLKE